MSSNDDRSGGSEADVGEPSPIRMAKFYLGVVAIFVLGFALLLSGNPEMQRAGIGPIVAGCLIVGGTIWLQKRARAEE